MRTICSPRCNAVHRLVRRGPRRRGQLWAPHDPRQQCRRLGSPRCGGDLGDRVASHHRHRSHERLARHEGVHPGDPACGCSAVVNTSSVYGLVASGAAAAYHAAKGGILMLSRAAAVEYASQGIRVNCIHPGRSPRVTAGRPRRRVTASSSSSAVWWMRNAVRPQMQAGIMGRLTCYSLALCSGSASLTAERTHDPLTFCPIPSG